jgi:hypothetical protein
MISSGKEGSPRRLTPAEWNRMGQSLMDSWRAYKRTLGQTGDSSLVTGLEGASTKVKPVADLVQEKVK